MINLTSTKKIIGMTLISLFLGLLFLKDFVRLGIPEIAFTTIWLLLLIFGEQSTLTAFSLAVVICFTSTISITIPVVTYIVLTIFRRKKIYDIPLFLISISVALVEFIRLLANNENFRQYVNIMAIAFLVYIVVTEIHWDHCSPVKCLKYYLAFFLFLSMDIIWSTAKYIGSISAIITGSFRIGQVELIDERAIGLLSMNSNGIAMLSILSISICLLLVSKNQMKPMSFVFWTIYSCFVGLLTLSKTFILVLLGLIVLYVFWFNWKNRGKLWRSFIMVSVLVVAIMVISQTKLAKKVLLRFSNGDLTSGRMEVFIEYINYMIAHPTKILFGIGLQSVTTKTGMIRVPHNAILEIYVCLGVFGMIAYSLYFVLVCRIGMKYRNIHSFEKHTFINIIPFIVYFMFIQGLQFMRISYIYASIAIVFACMVVPMNNLKNG